MLMPSSIENQWQVHAAADPTAYALIGPDLREASIGTDIAVYVCARACIDTLVNRRTGRANMVIP